MKISQLQAKKFKRPYSNLRIASPTWIYCHEFFGPRPVLVRPPKKCCAFLSYPPCFGPAWFGCCYDRLSSSYPYSYELTGQLRSYVYGAPGELMMSETVTFHLCLYCCYGRCHELESYRQMNRPGFDFTVHEVVSYMGNSNQFQACINCNIGSCGVLLLWILYTQL